MNAAERQLAAMAFALLPKNATISAEERRCVYRAFKPTRKQLADTKKAILAGGDPLGDELIAARSAEQRRSKGATYTPAVIVRAMLDWAANHPMHPARIVDPGSGSGRFLMEAAARFPKAQLVAIDVDPLATLILRANATIRGFASRLVVKLGDYRREALETIERPTLFIGNPPYVRHHDITPAWKDWFAETAASFGFTASKLAGLHIHFFLRTCQLAREGDFGTLTGPASRSTRLASFARSVQLRPAWRRAEARCLIAPPLGPVPCPHEAAIARPAKQGEPGDRRREGLHCRHLGHLQAMGRSWRTSPQRREIRPMLSSTRSLKSPPRPARPRLKPASLPAQHRSLPPSKSMAISRP